MRRKIVLCAVLAVSLLATACGQEKTAVPGTESTSIPDSAELPGDVESVPSAVADSNIGVNESGPAAPDEKTDAPDEKPDDTAARASDSWVDVSALKPNDDVVTDSTAGEGFNVIPGELVEMSESSREVKIGDTVTVDTAAGSFDLTVNSIRLTDDRAAGVRADRVVEVTYTYTNLYDYPDLIVGDLSFMMLDSKNKALATYIFDPTDGKHPQPMPIGAGEERTIVVGYILPKEAANDVTLIYRANFEEEDSFEFYVKTKV